MAKPALFISRVCARAREFANAEKELFALLNEYTAMGGETYINGYFLDELGAEKADLPVTKAQIIAFFETIAALENLNKTAHAANIYGAAS